MRVVSVHSLAVAACLIIAVVQGSPLPSPAPSLSPLPSQLPSASPAPSVSPAPSLSPSPTITLPPTPAPSRGGLIASTVSTGYQHTCVITNLRNAVCWGWSGGGALGDGKSLGLAQLTPIAVNNIPFGEADKLDMGTYYGIVSTTAGEVYYWGGSDSRYDATADYNVASAELPRGFPIGVAGGYGSFDDPSWCVIMGANATSTSGEPWCWGYSGPYGMLGDGTLNIAREIPGRVLGLPDNVTTMDVGQFNGCAITEQNASLWCWGRNTKGQLGDGTKTHRWEFEHDY